MTMACDRIVTRLGSRGRCSDRLMAFALSHQQELPLEGPVDVCFAGGTPSCASCQAPARGTEPRWVRGGGCIGTHYEGGTLRKPLMACGMHSV